MPQTIPEKAPGTVPEIAYVDCLAALKHARAQAPDARLVTDNPLLAADRRAAGKIENIDRLVAQADAAKLGRHALDIAAEIDRRLAAMHSSGSRRSPWPGRLQLAGTTSRLIASLLYRGAVLGRCLAALDPGRIHLVIADQPRFDPLQPFLLPYFASPCRPLAETGFFGQRQVSIAPVEAATPGVINDTAIGSLAGRVAPLPWSVILFEITQRLGLRPPLSAKRIFVLGSNDSIRETFSTSLTRMPGAGDSHCIAENSIKQSASSIVMGISQTSSFSCCSKLASKSEPPFRLRTVSSQA